MIAVLAIAWVLLVTVVVIAYARLSARVERLEERHRA